MWTPEVTGCAEEGHLGAQTLIVNYGYLAIFVLMLAESAGVPVPSELTMLFGGALAAVTVAVIVAALVVLRRRQRATAQDGEAGGSPQETDETPAEHRYARR